MRVLKNQSWKACNGEDGVKEDDEDRRSSSSSRVGKGAVSSIHEMEACAIQGNSERRNQLRQHLEGSSSAGRDNMINAAIITKDYQKEEEQF